jgi:hypothetical protein
VDEHPHEKCREDDARISWTKASGDWGQVIPKMLKDKEIMVGATGAKVKNKINDLCTLTSYSGALIANGNFQRRPPHPRVKLGWQLRRERD